MTTSATTVPEPSSLILSLIAALGLVRLARNVGKPFRSRLLGEPDPVALSGILAHERSGSGPIMPVTTGPRCLTEARGITLIVSSVNLPLPPPLNGPELMPPARFSTIVAMACCAFFFACPTTGYGVGQSYTGGTYSENFDSPTKLSNAVNGTSVTWADFSAALPGWALRRAGDQGQPPSAAENNSRDVGTFSGQTWQRPNAYFTSDGTSGTQNFYSYGQSQDPDRALGLFENNASGPTVIGGDREILLIMANDSTTTFTSFTLAYDGEQWRSTNNSNGDSLVFDYTITAANMVITEGNYTTNWSRVSALDFNSPILTAGGSLNGNLAANRRHMDATVSGVSWQPGQWLTMRWWSNNAMGSDQGLAIDNLVFSAPEPSSFATMLLGMFVLTIIRRKRAV